MLGPLEVAVAVIKDGGRVLITQRKPGDSFGGLWEFPGGKLNDGESMEAALVREIEEELGVRVEVAAKRMVIRHQYPARAVRLHCFDCRLLSGEPRAIECAAWQWVDTAELAGFEFLPGSRPLIEHLVR
ncbi:MAG: (deoxy)nucleoside triphosphate pyrophosphohydrolase [Candidatus Omnitrophica bacterium]|nr:(deoxy)nucleoside triphosphate pyrophosphohydrolase [Candidatus Omnitrophota bacterium]